MRFKIERRDGTVIYANDICINNSLCAPWIGIWADDEEIDTVNLSDIDSVWLLDPVRDICILV